MRELRACRIEGLRRTIGPFVLEADFSVGTGERIALIGPSGSGKTSLLRAIAGLELLQAGRVLLGDRDVASLPPEKREIGYVFQDAALFPALNVIDNLTFGLKMRGMGTRERIQAAEPWLARLGLAGRAREGVDRLSGGERQRIAFGRALIWKPKLLLLDEPFSALDRELRRRLGDELLALHALWPAPMVLVTHDEGDAERLGTRWLRIESVAEGAIRRVSESR